MYIYREYWQYDVLWVYFVIALGSVPVTVVYLVEPHDPFAGDWILPRSMATYTTGERKALTFLKTSSKIRTLVFQTGFLLFFLAFLFPIMRRFSQIAISSGQFMSPEDVGLLIGLVVLHLLMSFFIQQFITNRYLMKHWDEIVQSDIEPWPVGKPYGRKSLEITEREKARTEFLTDVFYRPLGPFNWYDFLIYAFAVVGFFALWIAISGSSSWEPARKVQWACVVVAPLSWFIAYQLWSRKQKRKK